ncbi:hypothetical protein GALMADRAFT_213462 [Galerina marginata CBS 339.88]|uniref:Uncharacterized protein n=1 Tax=Galerina marginata (strain CBS 339.88) TaxID=685588 RepID=A0A067SZ17_GALM3|nr:hypothetical protein GALMADRAFT_213462 [Galerina marginata CBS 339.88]
MQLTARNIITLVVLAVACVYAAPTTIERRATDLQVSLRESQPGTTAWHFALVIHAPGKITDSGTKNTVYHHVIDTESKCLEFQEKDSIRVKTSHISATATLIAAKQEKTDEALRDSAVAIFKTVPNSPVTPEGGFPNCLDFAVDAVGKLHANGYVSEEDYQQFDDYRTKVAQEVRDKTDKGTVEATGQTYLCTRANKKCTPSKSGKK